MFASLILRQADLATTVEWIEIHFDIYIYHTYTLIDRNTEIQKGISSKRLN